LGTWPELLFGRQYDLALEQLVKSLAIDSTFHAVKVSMGLVLLEQKKYTEAIQLFAHFGPDRGFALSYAYAASGTNPARIELKKALQKTQFLTNSMPCLRRLAIHH